MSFILANVKKVWRADAQGDDTKVVLKNHNPCTYTLPSAKLVNLVQPYYLNNKCRLTLMTDVESFLLKSQKMLYLKQIQGVPKKNAPMFELAITPAKMALELKVG